MTASRPSTEVKTPEHVVPVITRNPETVASTVSTTTASTTSDIIESFHRILFIVILFCNSTDFTGNGRHLTNSSVLDDDEEPIRGVGEVEVDVEDTADKMLAVVFDVRKSRVWVIGEVCN